MTTSITLIGGPTALIEVDGFRLLTDPTFDEPGAYQLPHVKLEKLAGPALAAGAVLCWARALGEFGATITFAGNYPGTTQTMPLAVYLSLESSHPERGIVLSLVLLVVSLGVLVGLRDRWLGVA